MLLQLCEILRKYSIHIYEMFEKYFNIIKNVKYTLLLLTKIPNQYKISNVIGPGIMIHITSAFTIYIGKGTGRGLCFK